MLSGLFPEDVAIAWGSPDETTGALFPEEAELVARAVEKRRREFAKGRECARLALSRFGRGEALLLAGKDREPLWPADTTGSITHTQGLCAAVAASSARYLGLGIDAEPAEALSPELVERICSRDEARKDLAGLELALVPRLIFSVKEAVYKCQFPISRRFLGFSEVTVELGDSTFRATLGVDAPPFAKGSVFSGNWRLTRGATNYLVAGAWLSRPPR